VFQELVRIGMQTSRFWENVVVNVDYRAPLWVVQRGKLVAPFTVVSLIIFFELHMFPPVLEKGRFNGTQL
jgi:hypothetical protein